MHVQSLHHLTMIDAHPLALIEAAAAGGFTHCGIRLVAPRPGDPLVDVLGETGGIAAVGRKLRDTGIKLLDVEAIWLGPGIDMAGLRPALEAAARLGARYVLVVGNDDDRSRLVDRFGVLCAMAAHLGLTVMLEFITYCEIASLEQAATLVGAVGAPNAGLLIDALQFFRSGADLEELARHDPSLFGYVQICDGPLHAPATAEGRKIEAREDRLLPGQGELPVHALMAALPPGLPVSLEAPSRAMRELDFIQQGRLAGAALRSFLAGAPGPATLGAEHPR